MGHYVYKYVFNDEIVYIGKNDTDLHSRIYQHTLENKFKSVKDAQIYFIELQNSVESRVMEELLINKYKPSLNVVSKKEGLSISFEEPSWKKYTPPIKNDGKLKRTWYELDRRQQIFLKICCDRLSTLPDLKMAFFDFKTISEMCRIENSSSDIIKNFLKSVFDSHAEIDIGNNATKVLHWIDDIIINPDGVIAVSLNETMMKYIKKLKPSKISEEERQEMVDRAIENHNLLFWEP